MRLVKLSSLTGGEVIAKPVVDVQGRKLLTDGTRFNMSYAKRLLEMGVDQLYIEDEMSCGIEAHEIVSEHTKLEIRTTMSKELLRYTRRNNTVDTSIVYHAATKIIDEVLNTDCIYDLHDIKLKDEYTLSHSINVAVLSALVGLNSGMERDKITSMVMGSLLHDLGKLTIPDEILNKPGKLTAEEFEEIKKHPQVGYEMIKDNVNVSPITKVVVLMHHEKYNGTGYPNQLTDEKIHDTAKITAICDVFDALVSDRPYHPAWPHFEAIEYIQNFAGTQFDPMWVKAFIKCVASYPVGAMVVMNNDDVGIVVKNNKANLTRPQVRLLYNRKTGEPFKGEVINLMSTPTVFIKGEL